MLDYTSEDEIRKYFDTDETLSPEQIDAVRTAWNATITIINAVNPQDTTEDHPLGNLRKPSLTHPAKYNTWL